jgi:UDP-glucose 4-epimerase
VPRHVLVTGGFGFIGSYLVERLLAMPGTRVHVVDNLTTSPIDVEAYVHGLPERERLTYDVCAVEEFCARSVRPRFDEVYHLASVVGPVGVLSHAGRIAAMIVNDMARVAALAAESGARLVDVSTSEVYGGGRDGYCSERDFKIIQPKVTVRLEYAVGKLAAEIALVNMSVVSALSASIVRPFNVAGPRQSGKGGFVLPRFITQATSGLPLTVYGDGSMIRAFTHVADIGDGLLAVMERGRSGEAYNLGNPANKTTILDLARRVVRLTESRSEIVFVDPKALFGPLFEEANDKYPDADRSIHELGWQPKYDLDQIIRDTADYMRMDRRD